MSGGRGATERFRPGPVPDEGARERIRTDLDANLLVEAGAGSGKTTMLVERMLRLLATGSAQVGELAAVTFTRKAAGELRQRLQQALEGAARSLPAGDPGLQRVRAALDDLDSLFAGTIHAFCARLLRERPLEAGIDPGFRELVTAELMAESRRFWTGFLERSAARGDPRLDELEAAGIRPGQLRRLFELLMENLDVDFPAAVVEPPTEVEVEDLRREVSGFLDRALAILPQREPGRGWDPFQLLARDLRFRRRFPGWEGVPDFMDDLERVCRRDPRITLNRWPDEGAARRLRDDLREFGDPAGPARGVLERWWAHRYRPVVGFARDAALAFREYRFLNGLLSFQDLLEGAARLLREHPEARRDLGGRYRRLLVDEFQDTDPIQAELLLLLSSDPAQGNGWDEVVPRPGALFVVGDPKQSIYRFRRADIALYGRVKDRFRSFGDVVELTANFRSAPEVAEYVNRVFREEGGFPALETEEQAGFAPLDAMRLPTGRGAWSYTVADGNRGAVAADDAARVAAHVAREVAGGRSPADFLLLTRTRKNIALYARELEARNLPIQVSGAGVGVEEELHELLLLLDALADPGDPVRTVAALTGLFLGVDHQVLLDFRMAGGSFDLRRSHLEEGGGAAAASALNRLHGWWQRSRREAADVFLSGLAGELGLLPWAAAGELGSLRAGAMAYALDAVRAAANGGETSLRGAMEALQAALDVDEAETPLEPLRGEAVRLMNLHQAKGLEAAVVILAEPAGNPDRKPTLLVERGDGGATGWLSVEEYTGPFGSRVLARPGGWDDRAARARVFEEAEEVRLLYVAATRAEEELFVSRVERGRGSPWRFLETPLQEEGRGRDLPIDPRPPREVLEPAGETVEAHAAEAARRRREASEASYRMLPITALARSAPAPHSEEGESPVGGADPSTTPAPFTPDVPRGVGWGTVVHNLLALAGRGVSGDALRGLARSLLIEHERPIGADGEPAELDALVGTVAAVLGSALWERAARSSHRMAEVPFALPGERIRGPLGRMGWEGGGETAGDLRLPEVLEGVVDLVFRENDGWVVVDWKTDLGGGAGGSVRMEGYRRQVDLYAACWEALTGEPVKERILLFTRTGREERW